MKFSSPTLLFLFFYFQLFAQSDYFQQDVQYTIQVLLDDENHLLNGDIEIRYTNHAPLPLDTIYIHLWANAFRDQNSAYAQEQIRHGEGQYFFSKPKEKGSYDRLDFSINQQAVQWKYDSKHPDIAYILPDQPIGPGQTISINTPFIIKIPFTFSRFGHMGQSYQMTQWYPKVAVYDKEGWHPIPYLDQGEFFGEYASYTVNMTLPENYVVAATGSLQTESEKEWLSEKVETTQKWLPDNNVISLDTSYLSPSPSSDKTKMLTFNAENVHDFAWFASKDFKVIMDTCTLSNGKTISLWAYFLPEGAPIWKKATDYLKKSIRFFSDQIGPYPYSQVVAVQGPLGSGGGMEYPMITIIDEGYDARSLESTTAHEVAHNWWYGILGTNERQHPWIDEGFTSFYEQKYWTHFHGKTTELLFPNIFQSSSPLTSTELIYLNQARRGKDQAIGLASNELHPLNYYLGLYEKAPLSIQWLEAYLGEAVFKQIVQGFYTQWQFRHPEPKGLKAFFESQSQKNLSWFFEDLIGSPKKVDYAITKVKKQDSLFIHIQNKGEIKAPFLLAGKKDGKTINRQWVEGFEGIQKVAWPNDQPDQILIDPERLSLDENRQNNQFFVTGSLPRRTFPRIHILPLVEDDRYQQLFLTPVIGWNQYDRGLFGLAIYNETFPPKKWSYQLVPVWGTGSKRLSGLGQLQYHWDPSGKVQDIAVGLSGKSFTFFENGRDNYQLSYRRLMPYARMEWRPKENTGTNHQLQWRSIYLEQEEAIRNEGIFTGKQWVGNWIHELRYQIKNNLHLHPFLLELALEQQSYSFFGEKEQYLKASFTFKKEWAYLENRRFVIRTFLGGFIQNSRRNAGIIIPGAFNLISQGHNDYRRDDYYFGRSQMDGILSQQISEREGGFKTPISPAFSLGRSNNFIASLNLIADLPFTSILRPYLDLGYFDNAMPSASNARFQDQVLLSGGLAIEFWDSRIGFYLPFFNSKNLGDRLVEKGNFLNRIGIKIDLNRMHPIERLYDLTDILGY